MSMRRARKPLLGLLLALLLTFISGAAWAADPYVQSNTFSVGNGPTDIAVNPAGTKAYTTNYSSNTVTEIDLATGSTTSITVGTTPTSIAIDPTGTFAYVTNYGTNGAAANSSVSKIVLSTRVKTNIGSGWLGPRSVVFGPAGSNRAYVSNQGGSTVSVINTATDTVIAGEAIAVGAAPQDMALSADGNLLYVSRYDAGAVVYADLTTKTSPVVTTPITGLSGPQGLALAGTKLAVAERTASGAVRFYNSTTGAALSTVTGLTSPQTVTLSPSGTELYVANRGANNVRIIDLTSASPALTSTILGVGTIPFQLRFVPNQSKSVVANFGTNNVSIISYYQPRTLSFATTSYTVPFGGTQTVTATPSAGVGTGTISYSAGSSTACSVVASTGVVTVTAATGSCSISASITAGPLNVSDTWAAASTTTPVTINAQTTAIEITAGNVTVAAGATVTPSYSLTSGSLVSPNAISGMTYTYAGTGSTVYAASTTAPTNAGTYSITPSAAVFSNGSASNYNISYVAGSLTIQPVAITLTAGNQTLFAGASVTPSFTLTSGALIGSDSISSVTYTFTGTGSTTYPASTTAPRNVGTYSTAPSAAVFSRGSSSNYTISYANGSLTLQAVAITVSASSQTISYGQNPSPSFSITSGSLVSPDAISGVTYTYAGTGSTTYGPTTTRPTAAGTYSVTPSAAVFSSGSPSNYTIGYSAGNLTIQPAAITVTAGTQTQWATATITPTATITSGALVGSDTISGYSFAYEGTGSTTYPSSNTAPSSVGTYSITPSSAVFSAGNSSNYTITYSAGALNLVMPVLSITVTAGTQTIVEGASVTPSFAITSGTMAGSDSISSVTYTYSGTGSTVYAATTQVPTAAGTYSVTPSAAVLAPGNPANYTFTYIAGSLTINAPSGTTTVTLALSASIGSTLSGSSADVNSSGLQTTAPYSLTVQSAPQLIAHGNAVGGVANFAAPLPAGLEAGWHVLTFTSIAANGNTVTSLLYFQVSASGTLLATSATAPSDLPHTGSNIQELVLGGASLVFLGLGLVLLRRMRRV